RLRNDEFGISFIDVGQTQDIILLIEKILKKFSEPLIIGNNEIVISVCIGISIYPENGKDADDMIKKATIALLKTKQSGRKSYTFYTQGINVRAAEIVQIQNNLFKALKKDEFILHYQPCFDMNTKRMTGMEALIRWNSTELGLVSPGKFIPLLEETGMIIDVGKWILKEVIRQLQEWKANGYAVQPVSVNLSQVQFRQKDLLEVIYRTINRCRFNPSLIAFEITESTFTQDIEYTQKLLKSIKDIGVSVSIDDFGMGNSSLIYLKSIPVDNLKIDISFVREIALDPDAVSIATAIITVAHNLNINTIAEGVETEEQWNILKLLRCDMAQGYYLSPPLPPDKFIVHFKK
ncbi:MAG: EAL domain-containing protein, partial [Bacteroidetes bacterium]|nr:EAL domain-containing protein [Bacteroidota bacterium]